MGSLTVEFKYVINENTNKEKYKWVVYFKAKIVQHWTGKEDFLQGYCKWGEGLEFIWAPQNWNERWEGFGVSQWKVLEGDGGREDGQWDGPAHCVTLGFTNIYLYDQATCVC